MKLKATLTLIASVFIFILSSCNEVQENVLIEGEPLPIGYRICVIGDAGTAKAAQFRVIDALKTEGCDEFRYTGDVIYENGLESADDPNFVKKFYDPYKYFLEDLNTPFYLTMGNHDYYGDVDAWLEIAAGFENIVFPDRYYADIHGDICFLNLDTNSNRSAESKWLDQFYKETADYCKITVAFAHHPYKSVGQHGDAKWGVKSFLRKSVVGKVNAFFAGHDHNLSYEGVDGGTHLFVTGAAGKLRPLRREAAPGNYAISALGYIALEVNRGENGEPFFKYEFRALTDNLATEFTTVFNGEF